jgi:hypothetical protein
MSPVWIAFLSGLSLGGMAGIAVIAMCVAARNGDSLPKPCHCDQEEHGLACRECGRHS